MIGPAAIDLDPVAVAAGVRLVACDTLGSTNAEAMARARRGETGPLWITAARQTAGRGRRGRAFVSERGNLFASLLLADPSPPERAAELSFVAALALREAVVDAVAELAPRLSLKWPNDVLCDGAKFSGILVEGESGARRPFVTAVGIGVNCVHHPAGLAYPTTDLASCGADVSPQVLFRALSRTMLVRLAEWDRGNGFARTRESWLQHASGLGERIRVRTADRELVGRFAGLDASGRLMLRREDGLTEQVSSGDLFPMAAPRAHAARDGAAALGTGGEPA